MSLELVNRRNKILDTVLLVERCRAWCSESVDFWWEGKPLIFAINCQAFSLILYVLTMNVEYLLRLVHMLYRVWKHFLDAHVVKMSCRFSCYHATVTEGVRCEFDPRWVQ